jgi:SAM-dependent methyltransferase
MEQIMHDSAKEYVYRSFHGWRNSRTNLDILEIGSLDINGSVRPIFEPFQTNYFGIDMQKGPGVDLVADAAHFVNEEDYDVVVCAEVFEHTPDWKKIIANSYTNLRSGGLFIATMAGEGRPPHSAIDENPIRDWEHYSNIGAWELNQTLRQVGFKTASVNVQGWDTRCSAAK